MYTIYVVSNNVQLVLIRITMKFRLFNYQISASSTLNAMNRNKRRNIQILLIICFQVVEV